MGSWNLADAQTSVDNFIKASPLDQIEVKPWKREMQLSELTEKRCREIYAAHLYVDLYGIENTLKTGATDDDQKAMLQAMHAYMRVAIEAVESKVDGLKVQFQGSRLHAIFFRPYDDEAAICNNAVAALCYLRLFIWNHFAAKFPQYKGLDVFAGLDYGPALVTGLGSNDDRAVLFIGDAANRPAKVLGDDKPRKLALEPGALPHLKDGKLSTFVDSTAKSLNVDDEEAVLEALKLPTDVADLGKKLDACLESYTVDSMTVRKLTADIDWDNLGPTNSRKTEAANLFADLSGFTPFVEGRLGDEAKQKEAVQILHVLRDEFCRVAMLYGYERVAYQGDRLQAFRRNDRGTGSDAVEAAVAMRESLTAVVHEKLPASKGLHVAVGVASGEILLSRLGKRGSRERICLGRAARDAAQMEERLTAGKVGIDGAVRGALTEDGQDAFKWVAAPDKAYVNEGLTVSQLQTLLVEEGTHSLNATDRGIEVARSVPGVGVPYVKNTSWRHS